MTWVRTDDSAPLHPKFFHAGVAAFGWWEGALAYCNRLLTDGFIPEIDVDLVFPGTAHETALGLIDALIRAGLLHLVEGGQAPACRCRRARVSVRGYVLHDYRDYQPTRSKILSERAHLARVRSAAVRQGGVRSGQARKQANEANAKQLASPLLQTVEAPSRPTPDPITKDLTTLSSEGSTLHSRNGHRDTARGVLAWLNTKASRNFPANDTNLRIIEARLRDGAQEWQLKAIVSRKVRDWLGDPKMATYLRPATLFNATKCSQYLGDLPERKDLE